MSENFDILTRVRDALGGIEGVETSSIGLEANITADDYPMVRIVPSEISAADTPSEEEMGILIYYGALAHGSTKNDLEAQYSWLLDMEAKIKTAMDEGVGWSATWRDTVLDEDRVPGYKLFASRFVVT